MLPGGLYSPRPTGRRTELWWTVWEGWGPRAEPWESSWAGRGAEYPRCGAVSRHMPLGQPCSHWSRWDVGRRVGHKPVVSMSSGALIL